MEKDTLKDALETFARARDADSHNRKNWLDDVRFARLGEQWPEAIKKKRDQEGRPCLTINRLPAFIRQVTNDARQNKPSIKCHPVGDGADTETAEILNGLIRNIEYTSNADIAYDTALDHAVTGGFGYFRISTDYACEDAFDQDIRIERIVNPLTVFGDPYSTAADSSDWNDGFITDMWTKEAFAKRFPRAEASTFEADSHDQWQWFDDDSVRVAEWWNRTEVPGKLLKLSDGMVMFEDQYLKIKDILDVQGIAVVGDRPTKTYKVIQRIMSGAEILEENKWAGKYIPIVPVYGDEVNIEGKRHWISLVRFARDPQQMFNYWRTASTELVALAPKAPFIGPKGAFDSDPRWMTANTDTHAYLEFDGPQMPQRQPFAGPPGGALQEALNANDDMKSIMGLYNASLGAQGNETSGRAILARQHEGDTSTFNYIDNLSRAIRHAGRVIVDLIPKVYTTERIIRVIHEDGENESVQINAPFPVSPQQAAQDQQEQQEEAQGMVKIYDLTAGKYDVTCEVGPSYATKREEASAQMVEFIRAYPPAAQISMDILAKNLDWPGADELAKRFKAMLPPPAQGQNPQVMQMQQQMQQMHDQAGQAIGQLQQKLQEATAQANDKMTEAALKQRELDIKQYQAETDRLKTIQDAQNRESDRQARVIEAAARGEQAPVGEMG